MRVPAPDKGSAVPVSQASLAAEDESVAQHSEENLFELPDVKLSLVVAQAAKQEKQQQQQDGQGNSVPPPCPSVPGAADKDVFWRLNEGRFLAAARDQVLCSPTFCCDLQKFSHSRPQGASGCRVPPHRLQRRSPPQGRPGDDGLALGPPDFAALLLYRRGSQGLLTVRETSFKAVPSIYSCLDFDVSSPGCPETLKLYRDQYMKILEEDQAGFLRKIGSEGGGAYEVNNYRTFKVPVQSQ